MADLEHAETIRALRAERLRMHSQVLPQSLLGSAVLAMIVTGALVGHIDPRLVGGWLALVAVGLAVRLAVHLARPRGAAGDEAAERSLRRHRIAFAVHGAAWLAGGALMWAPGAEGQREFIAFAVATVIGGALIASSFDIVATLCFAVPAALPLLLQLLLRHPAAISAIDLIVALFVLTVALAAVRNQRGVRKAAAAQTALANKSGLLDQLLQTARQGFWFVDEQGRTTDINPAMCELLGRRREAVIGHGVAEFLASSSPAAWHTQPLGDAGGHELEILRTDGSSVHCLVTTSPLFGAAGERRGRVSVWTDISGRRAGELKLRTYEVVVNSISDLVSVVDENMVYRVVNDAWCRASGLSREQATGSSLDRVPAPSAADERRRALRECLELQEIRQVRSVLDLPGTGGPRYFETSYFPYADAMAGIRCVVLVSRDITEQERVREALAESATDLDRTLNATGDAIYASDASDPKQPARFANQQMLEMWGVPPEYAGKLTLEVLTRYASRLFVDPEAQGRMVAHAVATNSPHESQVRLKDGRVLLQRCIPAETGKRPLRVWTFRDITAEVNALEAAQARDAEQRALLEAFPGFIARLDANLRYTFANDRMLRLMGLPREAVIGHTVHELPGLTHPDAARACHLRALAGEVVVVERHYPEQPHRPATDMQITYAPGADLTGKTRVVYAFATDITPLKRSEAALLSAKEEAERANRAKSQFLSQMSHELRTPLNAILGFGQLLDAAEPPALAEPQRAYVQEILRGARHLLYLINEVLDLGSIEAGRLQLRPEPLDLRELGDECLRLVGPLAAERDVALPAAGSLPAQLRVQADRTRLKQVLLNLLGNAIKYNRHGGRVTLGAGSDGKSVRIEVGDQGPGLDADQQSRLFEPFERLGADRSGVEGTGIGLALSRGLVHAMGGQVGVASIVGHGSTFWIELPRADRASGDSAPGSPLPPAPTPAEVPARSVLYIEDNAINATLMQAMLARLQGLKVLIATDALQGLLMAQREHPAVILTDIQLPGIDGYEVLRRLRAQPSTSAIPVVAVSANAMPADVAAGLAAGFADYLAKPLEMAALHRVVLRLIAPPAGVGS